jgi:hypothetical protein
MKIKSLSVAAIIVAAVLAHVATTRAAADFSRRSLKGTYGFSGAGTLFGGAVQATVVGLNSFDRAGGCVITARINGGGLVTPLTTATCSYGVNSNGTGWIHVTFNEPPFGPFVSDFVIVDEARELRFILSDASGGTVASGVAKKQSGGGE